MKRAWVQYAQKVVGRYSMGHIRTVAPENLTVSERVAIADRAEQ